MQRNRPEDLGYRIKTRLLGPPLPSSQLTQQRLSKRLALGVLASDCISSSAYGTEEILLVLFPVFGLAAYSLVLPLTGVVLGVLVLVALSYRQVVMVYTKAGGSYVVARENFGPAVAQVAAVALMLDYIVTVAVQTAAGTAAVTSAIPELEPARVAISVLVVVLLAYGNLRGIREAGRAFALPTYFFAAAVGSVIVTGVVREFLGGLPTYSPEVAGAYPVGGGHALGSALGIFVLLKAFANGGASLTGLEAISNGVSVFHPPQGRNARRTLGIMAGLLAFLVGGVSWLAHETHAVPYLSGTPTVISQVTKAVFGGSMTGHVLFLLIQLATMLILYTGANTPFTGFPFLVNFVAKDSYLPRWLTKRGHRLAFSNGIILLSGVSLLLLLFTDAHVDKLVAFYAIGVFTGFTVAGFGMATHYRRTQEPHWKLKRAVNLASGTLSGFIVLILAVTKFTSGAWLVVIAFPTLTLVLIRLHRAYQREADVLATLPHASVPANYARHVILVAIDAIDLATLRAVRYARSLHPADLRIIHVVLDADRARALQEAWQAQPELGQSLTLVDCPDRRLDHTITDLVLELTGDGMSQVTVFLPRRTYSPLIGRIMHDHTTERIARAVTRIPNAAATIVPFDVVGALRAQGRRSRLGLSTVASGVGTRDPEGDRGGNHARR